MSWLNTEKPPKKYDPSYMKLFVERIRTAINFLDSSNFPRGLRGSVIDDKSVNIGKLNGVHFVLPIINIATPYVTNSTLVPIGGYVKWDTLTWFDRTKCKLVVTARVTAGTGEVRLVDDLSGTVETLEVTNTAFDVIESAEFFTIPITVSALVLGVGVNDVANDIEILSANIYIYGG